MTYRLAIVALLAATLAACERESGVMNEIARAEQEGKARAGASAAESAAFLARQRARAGVRATTSGLLYEVTRASIAPNLPRPPANAQVLVHYEGRLPNGDVFDSSFERGEPVEFPIGGVVPGFAEALRLMRPGDEMIAYLPANLGYGAEGAPPDIPPNSALQFRIVLLAWGTADGRIVAAPGLETR